MTAPLSGLTPGTTYHFRLVARSDAGTSVGADVTFTTVGVTLTAPALRVVYGRGILLAGTVPIKRAGEVVTVFAQTIRRGVVQLDRDGPDGRRRNVALSGEAEDSHVVPGELGRAQELGDGRGRPAGDLASPESRTAGSRHAFAGARSFAGRLVQLQRRTAAGRWVTIKRRAPGPSLTVRAVTSARRRPAAPRCSGSR